MKRSCFSSCGEALTTADELAAYTEREDRYQLEFAEHLEAASLAKSAKVKDSKTDAAKIGSNFAKLSVLCTHIGFSGLDKMSTAAIRAQRREGLPLLTVRMKKAGALSPQDKDTPLHSDEEVLRQFLWGSPKMRFLIWEIQRVVLGHTKAASHKKLLLSFQFPRSAEMCLKLVEFLGIRAVLLDTNMPPDERHNIRTFDEENVPQILITMYALNIVVLPSCMLSRRSTGLRSIRRPHESIVLDKTKRSRSCACSPKELTRSCMRRA